MQSGPQWSQKQEPSQLSVCRKMAGALGGWNRADGWGDWGARTVRGRGSQGSHVVKTQKIHGKQVAGRVRVRGPTIYPWSIVGPGNQQALILWAFPQARNPLLSLLLMQREKPNGSWFVRDGIWIRANPDPSLSVGKDLEALPFWRPKWAAQGSGRSITLDYDMSNCYRTLQLYYRSHPRVKICTEQCCLLGGRETHILNFRWWLTLNYLA